MPLFQVTYAYDVPCYTDFTVEADTEDAAEKIARDALRAGHLAEIGAQPEWDQCSGHRVFVQGEAEYADPMQDQIGFDDTNEINFDDAMVPWWIVTGRAHGDDEATTHVYHCDTKEDAIAGFKNDVAGPTECYIDAVYRCETEPEAA